MAANSNDSSTTQQTLRVIRTGTGTYLRVLRCDEGSGLISQAVQQFAAERDFLIVESPPHSQRTNGMVESKVKAFKQLWRVSCKDDFLVLAAMDSLDGLQDLCNNLATLINHMVNRSIGMAPIYAYLGGSGRRSPAQLKLLGDALSQVGSALPGWETADPTKHAH